MDPIAVTVLLAIHLVGSGCFMFLVWHKMPNSPGLARWWASSYLLGLACLGRLLPGGAIDVTGYVCDGVMLLALLLFNGGMREFVGREALRWQATAGLLALMVGGEVASALTGGERARHLALSVSVAAVCAWVVWTLVVALPQQPMHLRAPLRLLAAILGGMVAFVLVGAYGADAAGISVAWRGPFSQVFLLYASIAVVTVTLTLLWLLCLRLHAQLAEAATHDALTGVLNRNGLEESVKWHFERRNAHPLTALLVDVDNFKQVNDAYGHATGDLLLKAVAAALVSQLRVEDFVARVGGNEFLIGCADAPHEVALALARRLNERVGALLVVAADGISVVTCTISVGVSRCVSTAIDWETATREAELALHEIKAGGSNEVRPYPGSAAIETTVPSV